MEVWYIVLVLMFGGQQVEFSGLERFESRSKCHEQAVKFTGLPVKSPFALACASEVRPREARL